MEAAIHTRRARTALVLAALVALAGCGGSETGGDGRAAGESLQARLLTDPREDTELIFATSDHAVGDQRIAFVLVDGRGKALEGATARVSVARGGLESSAAAEVTARYEPLGRPVSAGRPGDEFDLQGIYVAQLRFDEPGRYSLLVEPGEGRLQGYGTVVVRERAASPAIGAKAPASDNPTVTDAAPETITTARPPDVELLRHSVRESLTAREPFVLVFATPAFCQSRACGPTVEIVDTVRQRIGPPVRFIHVEVYEGNDPRRGYNRWMKQWSLPTEPWIFVVDAEGTIRAKFEGIASIGEIEAAVRAIL
jgi:hypothetical protein